MKPSFLLAVAAALLVTAALARDESTNEAELAKFQGRWTPVYVEIEGKPIPQEVLDELKELELIVRDDKVFLREEGECYEGWNVSFKLDPTKNPKTIDIAVSVEDTKPKTSLGIYRLKGDL